MFGPKKKKIKLSNYFSVPDWSSPCTEYIDDLSRFVLILLRMRMQEFSAGNKNITKVLTNDQSDECFLPAENSHMRMRNKIKTNRDKSSIRMLFTCTFHFYQIRSFPQGHTLRLPEMSLNSVLQTAKSPFRVVSIVWTWEKINKKIKN